MKTKFSIDKTFRIYKLDNINRLDELTQTYVFRICDPRMFYARRKRISQTLRGRYDQILQNALVDVGKFKPEVNLMHGKRQFLRTNNSFVLTGQSHN